MDRDPNKAGAIPVDLLEANAAAVETEEWPPEVTAAFELAHLGFYCQAPHEVRRHAKRLAEEFGVVCLAELTDYADRAPISVAGIVTTVRIRTTKKGEQMAWVVLSDGTGGLECAVFPKAYEKLNSPTVPREGAFLVARGRLAREEATGIKGFLDEIVNLYPGAWRSALVISIEEHVDQWPATDMRAG